MNAVSSIPRAERAAQESADRGLLDRLLAALPLLIVYTWLSAIYVVEAWQRSTPWLFGDELQLTQLSRGIASTGHPMQRGVPAGSHSLYTWMTAPIWLIQHVPTAYAGVKYVDVLVMTAVVFPTYFLARMIVGRKAALFAAAGAGVVPSLAYTGYIVEENLAYPYAALCCFLFAKALVTRRRSWIAAAVVAALVAPFVRGELGVVPAVAILAGLFMAWSSDWARERRANWSPADWTGVAVLVLGGIFLFAGVGSHQSFAWQVATRIYKHRMINMTGWAAGALAIGIACIPVAAGLAALFRTRDEPRTRELRAFRSVALATLIAFGMYTAVKAAYLSYSFATRVEERNLLYVAPLLFVGTALLLDRRKANLWALAATTAFTAYLVGWAIYHPTQGPYEMQFGLYSDALGLAILQEANRVLAWTPETARIVLLSITLAGGVLLAALVRLRERPRVATALTAVLAVGVLGWALTGEISAAAGSNRAAKQAAETLRHPFSWVDDVTHGAPTIYMGSGEIDQNPEWLVEFWNRSIVRVGSFDGTVQGPGPAGSPNIAQNGVTYWTTDPAHPGEQFAYAVEDFPCVDYAGTDVVRHPYRAGGTTRFWHLVKLDQPNRLQAMCTGLYPDGWSGPADSSYFRFSGPRHGWLRVVISRRDWGGPTPPSPVHVQIGRLTIDPSREPALASVQRQVNGTIASEKTKVVWVPAPARRFAVHVVVDDKFVPSDYGYSDVRALGAEVTYRFFPKLPPHAKPTRNGF